MNLNFLLLHTTHLDSIMIFQFLVFLVFGLLISVFPLHFNQHNNIILQSQHILYFGRKFQMSALSLPKYMLYFYKQHL